MTILYNGSAWRIETKIITTIKPAFTNYHI